MAGPIRIDVETNARAAARDIDSLGSSADTAGGKYEKLGQRAKAAVNLGLLAAGAAVVKIGVDSVKAASEAEQAVGGVQAVFGKYAENVFRSSERAAEGVGLSSAAYNELAAATGAMLKNKGVKSFVNDTQTLIAVGADLSAQFGGSTKDAVDALNSALRGESDPIERYGISMNAAAIEAEALSLGLVKNVKNLDTIKAAQNTAILAQRKYTDAVKENGKGSDEALAAESSLIRSKAALTKALDGQKVQLNDTQKAQAAMSLVQKQAGDAAGAFARESDTLAGQQQRLGAEWDNLQVTLGNKLLPYMSQGAGLARKLVNNFDTVAPVLGVIVAGMAAYKVASLAAAAATAIQTAGTVGATGATFSLNAALRANPIGLVVTALTLLGAGLVIAYKKSETFRDIVKGALNAVEKGFDALGAAGTWLWNKALQPAFRFIVNGVASILDLWSSMLETLGKVPGFGWAKDAAEAMGNAADKAREMADGIKKIPPRKDVTVAIKYTYSGLRAPGGSGPTRGRPDDLGGPSPRLSYDAGVQRGRRTLEGVADGLRRAQPKAQAAAGKVGEKIVEAIRNRLDQARELRNSITSLRDSIADTLTGDLFGTRGDESGTALDKFRAIVAGARATADQVLSATKALLAKGVSKSFLDKLIASGNTELIVQLGGAADAAQLAKAYEGVIATNTETGRLVAEEVIGTRLDVANTRIDTLTRQLAERDKAQREERRAPVQVQLTGEQVTDIERGRRVTLELRAYQRAGGVAAFG